MPFRDDPPTYWDELYEVDFDWLYRENLKSRPPSTPALTHDTAADDIVSYTDRQLIRRPRAGAYKIGTLAKTYSPNYQRRRQLLQNNASCALGGVRKPG